MKEKAICFISEYLVIVLDKSNIVDNMHEAYKRIEFDPQYQFGSFISGLPRQPTLSKPSSWERRQQEASLSS